jgi:HAD superfamily hydrolase (TIGR01509 family)
MKKSGSAGPTRSGPFEFIFWDNDGILVDTEWLYFEATRQTLASIGIPFGEEEYRKLFLQEGRGAWHLAREAGLSGEETQNLRQRRNQMFSELLGARDLLVPGASAVLERLSPAYRHAIVTSSRRDHFTLIHKNTGLLPFFSFVLTREDYTNSKPNPEPYTKALLLSGVPSGKCLVVEDSERGLRAAKSAGLTCWIVPSVLTRGSDFRTADRVLQTIGEVAELLDPVSHR